MNYVLWLEGTERELMVLDEILTGRPQMRIIRTTLQSFMKINPCNLKYTFI